MAAATYYIAVWKPKDGYREWEVAEPDCPPGCKAVQGERGIYTFLTTEGYNYLAEDSKFYYWKIIEVMYDKETGECY